MRLIANAVAFLLVGSVMSFSPVSVRADDLDELWKQVEAQANWIKRHAAQIQDLYEKEIYLEKNVQRLFGPARKQGTVSIVCKAEDVYANCLEVQCPHPTDDDLCDSSTTPKDLRSVTKVYFDPIYHTVPTVTVNQLDGPPGVEFQDRVADVTPTHFVLEVNRLGGGGWDRPVEYRWTARAP